MGSGIRPSVCGCSPCLPPSARLPSSTCGRRGRTTRRCSPWWLCTSRCRPTRSASARGSAWASAPWRSRSGQGDGRGLPGAATPGHGHTTGGRQAHPSRSAADGPRGGSHPFLAELHTLVTLQHEGIARIYDGGIHEDPHTHDQFPYLVMELVRGGLPITTYAKDYALSRSGWPCFSACVAPSSMRMSTGSHRDLKPANILWILRASRGDRFWLACAYDALLPGAHLWLPGRPPI